MQDAVRRVPRSLDLIGQGCPRLRHAKQRRLAPGIRKLVSDLEAVDGAPPVERYEFAGRHPLIPSASFRTSRTTAVCSQSPEKLLMSFARKAYLCLKHSLKTA